MVEALSSIPYVAGTVQKVWLTSKNKTQTQVAGGKEDLLH
jgi:hypothetical protein